MDNQTWYIVTAYNKLHGSPRTFRSLYKSKGDFLTRRKEKPEHYKWIHLAKYKGKE